MYDADNAETADFSLATKIVYEIRLDRLVTAPSTSSMVLAKGTSKSEFNLEVNAQVSGPPMSGQW